MRDFGSYYRDPFNLQDTEVLKGPDSRLIPGSRMVADRAGPPRRHSRLDADRQETASGIG